MAFELDRLYTKEEQALALSAPLTDDIMLSARRMGTAGISWFGYDILAPQVAGLLSPTDHENAIAMTLYRLIGFVRTCYDLGHPYQFQSLASATRSIFELSVDAILLGDLTKPARAEQFHASTRILRYRVAKKLMNFYTQRPDLHDAANTQLQQDLLATVGLDAELEALSQKLWNAPLKDAPDHWTQRHMGERCDLVGDKFALLYRHEFSKLSFYVHAGGAGVGGITPEAFKGLEILCREIIAKVVPAAYHAVGVALYVHRGMPDFFERLEWARRYVELVSVIESRLRASGHPGKIEALSALPMP